MAKTKLTKKQFEKKYEAITAHIDEECQDLTGEDYRSILEQLGTYIEACEDGAKDDEAAGRG